MTDHPRNLDDGVLAGGRAASIDLDRAADVRLLADLLADRSTWVEPDPGLEGKVLTAVALAEQAPGPAAMRPRLGEVRQPAPNRLRVVGPGMAIAAAIAIVVGITTMTQDGSSTGLFKAELTATALVPGARASADIARTEYGFRITLDSEGLPASPPGAYYQAWLRSRAGALVPIGTFSSGDGRVILWSGVSPEQFPTITVTIESTANTQTSSGRRILIGEVRSR